MITAYGDAETKRKALEGGAQVRYWPHMSASGGCFSADEIENAGQAFHS